MKDYTFDLEQQKEFVLNYIINDNNIIINFADGTKYVVPNTKTNEERILKQMKEQVIESKKYEKNLKSKIIIKKILTSFSSGSGFIMSLGVAGILLTNDESLGLFLGEIIAISAIPLTVGFIFRCCNKSSCRKLEEKLEDLEKNKFFLKNEKTIKKALSNNNILTNARSEVKTLSNEQNLNLNVIDNYSFEDLKEVTEFVKLEDSFEFDQFEEVQKEPVKTRKRRR